MSTTTLPFPPRDMRILVGPTDEASFDNPSGRPIYEGLIPDSAYQSVLDIGCGCGRVARRLMLQTRRPERYLGFDPHRGMIKWCRENLERADPSFKFAHLDIQCPFNPSGVADVLPFPSSEPATLIVAHSVYTHLFAHQTEHYLREMARLLAPGGIAMTTWLLFDKRYFPFMLEEQNELYVHRTEPWAAVLYDRAWVMTALEQAGLSLVGVAPPEVRGHQWTLLIGRAADGAPRVDLPERDEAPFGIQRAERVADPANIGLDPDRL